jgi:ubiquinone/menaquinone biosynthesis C-methylase UbiE
MRGETCSTLERSGSSMVERAIDPVYLSEQYGTEERLRIRIEAHQRYSERADDYLDWILDRLQPRPGDLVVDVGCGVGSIHPPLCTRGVRAVLGVDVSKAMVQASQRQANERGLPVIVIEADAQALPLPDDAYDCAMANHMLFHVPDQRAALRELRRVLRKPHGRVVLTAAAPEHRSRLREIHKLAAENLGYTPAESVMHRFNLDHLDLVREVFPTAERFIREDAFLFPTAEAALRYYASGAIDAIDDRPADGSHRPRLLALVGERIQEIVRSEGVFRDPKDTGCFVATVS